MHDKYKGEHVLVFPRTLLEEIGEFQGTSSDVDSYLSKILDKQNNKFALRVAAEDDPSLQQIIPYVLFYHGGEVFSYVRGKGAGEARLKGNRSIGIGGHINPQDETLFAMANTSSDMSTYLEAVIREINEEVIVDEEYTPEIIGLIKDDGNPVGKVHFGVVHLCQLKSKSVRKKERQITAAGFVSLKDLAGPRREELESWSAYCVDLLIEKGL